MDPFRLDTPCYEIPGGGSEATFGAVMEMLLRVRVKLRLDSAPHPHDEDVNIYLAGLMVSYIDPQYLQAISRVVSEYELDVFEAVEKSPAKYQSYWIYKVNADDLLIGSGIFTQPERQSKSELIKIQRYYNFASSYQRQMYGRATAVGDIQIKLAESPQRYLSILSEARSEYMHLVEQMGAEELAEFNQRLRLYEQQIPLKSKQNELLDAYLEWRREGANAQGKAKIQRLIEEVQKLDPDFKPIFMRDPQDK